MYPLDGTSCHHHHALRNPLGRPEESLGHLHLLGDDLWGGFECESTEFFPPGDRGREGEGSDRHLIQLFIRGQIRGAPSPPHDL